MPHCRLGVVENSLPNAVTENTANSGLALARKLASAVEISRYVSAQSKGRAAIERRAS